MIKVTATCMGSSTKYQWHELRTAAHACQFFHDEISPSALKEGCLSWLSTEERTHWEKFRTERSRHDYLAARALCRATLSRYTSVDPPDWSFGTGLHGKPRIIGPLAYKSLRFSLAHTSGLVICLVSRASEVGVDAEETSRSVDVTQMARHFLSRQERARLENLPAGQHLASFYEQWVLREAYLKGIGKGIASAPERFTIKLGEDGQPLPIGGWQFHVYRPSAKHVAAAAIRQRRGAAPVSVHWLKVDGPIPSWSRIARPGK
jgi:4'-phosphopantetheinyl transferase